MGTRNPGPGYGLCAGFYQRILISDVAIHIRQDSRTAVHQLYCAPRLRASNAGRRQAMALLEALIAYFKVLSRSLLHLDIARPSARGRSTSAPVSISMN